MHVLRIAFLALIAQATSAPQSQSLVGSVEGVVFKIDSNEPIVKATVELRRPGITEERPLTFTTSKDGRFAFLNVPAGEYQLAVTRQGFVKTTYSQRKPGGPGTPIKISAEQVMSNVRLAMTPTGSISGRILNREGQPLGNATVYAMKLTYTQGVRGTQRGTELQSVNTNDLGEYRLFWLVPGQYYVVALPTVGSRRGIGSGGPGPDNLREFRFRSESTTTRPEPTEDLAVEVYYPGTFEFQSATPVAVKAGEDVRGIDFFAGPVPSRHIRGVVISAESGQLLPGSPILRLATATGTSNMSSPTTTFDLGGIRPGIYTMSATINDMSGSIPLEVRDGDVDNVVIRVSKGFNVSGHIVIEGATAANPGPDLKTLRVNVRPEPATGVLLDPGISGPDGTFSLKSLYAGNYLFSINPPLQNAYVKSIQFENREVSLTGAQMTESPSTPITIVISTNPGTFTGTVLNEKQEPVPNAIVALVPENPHRSRTNLFKNVTSDPSGRFRIPAVTPGQYKLFAWEEVENSAWLNEEFIRNVEDRGTAVQIKEGESLAVTLKTIPN